jgi:calcium-dependent protein kinase
MVASAQRRGPRNRTTSILSFTQRDESGRGYIAQSIRNTSDLFKNNYDDMNEIGAMDISNRSNIPFDKTIEEVYSGVHDGPVLGFGISGIVRKITNKETKEEFAVKRLNLTVVDSEKARLQLIEEIDIMCQLDHPNVIRLEEIYESDSIIYLVQELCHGGELFDQLDNQEDYHYSEDEARELVKQVLSAVSYLHSQGIVHRDLKLENFLFATKDSKSTLKMIDFGLSKHFKYDDVHVDKVGTPYTVAPEVIKGKYDEKCDVWGIGVIAYMLLCGDSPFGGCDPEGAEKSLKEIRTNILSGRVQFEPEDTWAEVSEEAKDFIRKLLTVDPSERPTAREVRRLPYLNMEPKQTKKDEPCANCFPFLNPILAKLQNKKISEFEAR